MDLEVETAYILRETTLVIGVICIYNLADGRCTYLSTDNYIDVRDAKLSRLDYPVVFWLTPKL